MIIFAPPPQIVCIQQGESQVGDHEKFCEALDNAIEHAPDEATAEALRAMRDAQPQSASDSGGHGGTIPPNQN